MSDRIRPSMDVTEANLVTEALLHSLPYTQKDPAAYWTDLDTKTLKLHNRICRLMKKRGYKHFRELEPPEGVDL